MNSKIDLRSEAVRLAVNVEGVTPENVISVAKEIEAYILGDVTLPEAYDPNESLTKMTEALSKGSFLKPTTYETAVEEAKVEESVAE